VDIIILTKNHPGMLKKLINSIYSYEYQQEIKIKIVDNDSDDHSALAYYAKIEKLPEIEIIPYKKTFNYSEANNLGVANSDSELILLLNDDMQVINGDWLSELSQWAIRPEIGVVGAKLIRANHTIQHAGIIMGLTGFVGHIYLNAPEHYFGLWGSVDWYRDIMAVTGACQMFRREVFQEVGGYDEKYQLAFGDVDFCCRVAETGYRNIYTPFAQLLHYEGSTRGYITPVPDTLRGYEKLAPYLHNEDPYFSTNLTYTRIPKCKIGGFEKDQRTAMIRERKKFYDQIENNR
jgi:GT2 family glycosyltransferase